MGIKSIRFREREQGIEKRVKAKRKVRDKERQVEKKERVILREINIVLVRLL